jgi:hypothetical protein
VMPDPDDIPLAEVAWQVSHSALWLREILAESQEIANRPTCSFTTTSGANRYGQRPSTRRLARRSYRHRERAPRHSPGLAIIERDGHWHINGTLRVAGIAAACARVQNFIPGASA